MLKNPPEEFSDLCKDFYWFMYILDSEGLNWDYQETIEALEPVAQLEEFIRMFTVEDLRGVFNHYMEMQKQAIHGQSDEFTVNFWKEKAGKRLKIIEMFEVLEVGEVVDAN